MTIEQTGVIDIVVPQSKAGEAILYITDHLSWDDNVEEHMYLLQEKLNTCFAFAKTGELGRKFPKSIGRPVVVCIVGKYNLSDRASDYFERMRKIVASHGYELRFQFGIG